MADLLTVSEVARYLAIDDDLASQRETIAEMIDAAQAVIERYANRTLDATERTEYYNARGMSFYADHAPITAIGELADNVQYTERTIDLSDDVVTDSEDGGANYRKGLVELWNDEGGFSGGRLNVRINYTAGWTTATLPADIRQAWIELVVYWFNNPERVGLTQAGQDGETVQWENAEVPTELARVFKAYRLARMV